MTKKPSDDEIRAKLVAEHDALLGEGVPDQTEDPLREWEDPVKDAVAKAVVHVKATKLNHLPDSQHKAFVKQLQAALDDVV